MCNAGPRPSFGCISHSFAGPVTSPPHFRHFTKRSSPRWGRQSVVGHGCTLDGQATLGLVGGVAIFRMRAFLMSNSADCHGAPIHF
jgi:hypothetical protein